MPDDITKAAGILFLTEDNQALFLKRGAGGDHPGEWCFPGGQQDGNETAEETAERETVEELGFLPKGKRAVLARRISANAIEAGALPEGEPVNPVPALGKSVDYTTFLQYVDKTFEPKLNGEHTGFAWAKSTEPPEPLHPGARIALQRLTMDELDIARAMSVGDLTSPQRYMNVWLFAIRITGTGMAYRKSMNEYVWRDAEHYLTDRFVARCNGLAVIWEHPKGATLNSEEYNDRAIGSVMLPYIQGDEVWGIAKIYDAMAAMKMWNGQLSTSPTVVFRDPKLDNDKVELPDGDTLLIEGNPGLLDHIAVCDLGVWDKAGPPVGILNNELTLERADSMPTEIEKLEGELLAAKARADAFETKFADSATVMAAMAARMDSMEAADKARKDAEDKAKADAEDKAKADAEAAEKEKADAAKADAEERAGWMKADAEMCAKDDADEKAECAEFEKKGDPKDVAADKAKKARKDRMDSRKDAEEKAKADAARADSVTLATLQAEITALKARSAPVSDDDRAMFADEQIRADAAYQAHGIRGGAPAQMQGESLVTYQARLAGKMKAFSPAWKDVDLATLPAAVRNNIALPAIYADAMVASARADGMAPGTEREIVNENRQTGQRVSTFVGTESFVHALKRPTQLAKFNLKPGE